MSKQAKYLNIGDQLDEYRIDDVLGVGAFGITYKAHDTHLSLDVAIKEYFPQELATRGDDYRIFVTSKENVPIYEWAMDRFLYEGKVLAKFKHQNIVRVNRLFKANGTAYIVMDYEDGDSLQVILKRSDEAMNEQKIKKIFVPILQGLEVVHEQHYLHRDIKPGNIFIRKDDIPILLDFGAATLEMSSPATDPTTVVTPGYAPVEQYYSDGKQGPSSDIYSIGATIYRCLVQRRPVEAIKRVQEMEQATADPNIPAVEAAEGKGSKEFLESIDWMLSIEPQNRPQCVGDVISAWTGKKPDVKKKGKSSFTYIPEQAFKTYKLLVAGPVGVGKSTAISTLCEANVFSTDQNASDHVRGRKDKTTVAMDYGTLKVSDHEQLHIYGIPGQERFSFMWEILEKGAIGLLLLIDNSRRSPFQDLKFFLNSFKRLAHRQPVVVGVNRMDTHPQPTIDEYNQLIKEEVSELPHKIPVFEADPRQARDMEMMISALLYTLDPAIEKQHV